MIGSFLEAVVEQEAEEPPEESLEGGIQRYLDSEAEEKEQGVKYQFFDEEELMELGYDLPVLDYEKLWYSERTSSKSAEAEEESEEVEETSWDTECEYINNQEAEKTIQDIHYAAVLGTVYDVDEDRRSDLDLWIMFNPELFKLFEASYAISQDIDY